MLLEMSNDAFLGNTVIEAVRSVLPARWSITFASTSPGKPYDGTVEIEPPSGRSTRLLVEIKDRFEPRNIDALLRQIRQVEPGSPVMLVTRYLSERSRDVLREHGFSYADTNGNVRIEAGTLFVDRIGAGKPPIGDTTAPRTSLRGPITGRVVRYLCDSPPPMRVREIATETNVHAGNISRILDFLERERLIVRDETGSVIEVFWEPLIRRWSKDLGKNRVWERFLEPHGLDAALRRLLDWDGPYAITASYAAFCLAPAAPPAGAHLYVADIEAARRHLSLKPAEGTGNIFLVEPYDRVALERTIEVDALILAAPSQIAADLLTVKSRSNDQYDALVQWMQSDEHRYRP